MKKIYLALIIAFWFTNFTFGQTLMSDEDHRMMMNTYEINLNTVLTNEMPQDITIDQFKEQIVTGELTLSSSAQASILTYAAPLKNYGGDFATANGLTATSDAYKYFYSSFSPSTVVENGKLVENINNSIMTPLEMWDCALGYFNTNNCGRSALISNPTNMNKLATTCIDLTSQQAGNIGILMMINGFSECMKVYLMPDIKFIPLDDVINTDSEITQSLNNLIIQTTLNEYVIDSTSVAKMTRYDGVVTYTFTIVPKPEDTFFQNIVIESKTDGTISNYLTEYETDNFQRVSGVDITPQFTNTIIHPITELPPIYQPINAPARISQCIRQYTVGSNYQYCPADRDSDLPCFLEKPNGDVTYTPVEYIRTALTLTTVISIDYSCLSGGGGGNYHGGGGGGGFGGSTPKTPTPVVTTPNTQSKIIHLFETELDDSEFIWWKKHENKITVNQIKKYLIQPNADIEFCHQFVTQSTNNPDLNLDFNSSLKSPFNVDTSEIDILTPEGKKFMEVYGALMKSPKFRHLFTSLFGQSPFTNVKFSVVDIPQPNNMGHIDGKCKLFYIPNEMSTYNLIQIDRQHLLTKSKVNIALTILHECIHAYLNVKFIHPTIALPISQIDNMDFQTCISEYYNGFSGDQTEHTFFVDFMIPTMVEILMEAKEYLVTEEQKMAIEQPTNGGAILYKPLYQPPTDEISDIQIPWNWKTFFTYFCYNGLDKSASYPFSIPFITNDDFYRAKYISCFNTIFNP